MIGRRLVPFGVAALLLAGCAESPDVVQGPQAPVGGASQSPKPKASDELSDALAEWQDFPADAEPRTLIILRNISGGGFKTGEAKIAFMEGNWRAPDELPATPEEFGGYPVIDAADALEVLRDDEADGRTTGSSLAIEQIRLVTVPDVATDRGPRICPLGEWISREDRCPGSSSRSLNLRGTRPTGWTTGRSAMRSARSPTPN